MFGFLLDKLIFSAPAPSYNAQSYRRHLCWLPWSEIISPRRAEQIDEDGIPCLWFPATQAQAILVYFHANAEDLGMSFHMMKHMRDKFKVNVLAVEFPGYGLLEHVAPSEASLYEVALTTFRFLVDEMGIAYQHIFLLGRSLGSGPAVFLASRYPIGGLILVSPFASMKAAVKSIAGGALAWTVRDQFPNDRLIQNVSCPTLLIHGRHDRLIPTEHSVRLFEKCRGHRKLLVTPDDMRHNSHLFSDPGFLAVPVIHFFGFPGYCTTDPPRLPVHLFEWPRKKREMAESKASEQGKKGGWICTCISNSNPRQTVEDISVPFAEDHSLSQIEGRCDDPANATRDQDDS